MESHFVCGRLYHPSLQEVPASDPIKNAIKLKKTKGILKKGGKSGK
jgi:hypothetical protein